MPAPRNTVGAGQKIENLCIWFLKLCVIRKCRRIEDCLDVGHPWGYGRYAPVECEKSYYGELGRCIYEKSPQNSICWWKTNRMLKYTIQRFTSERAAKLQTVKVGGWSLHPGVDPGPPRLMLRGRIFFTPPTLTACNFAASWPTETHSTSLERSKPP